MNTRSNTHTRSRRCLFSQGALTPLKDSQAYNCVPSFSIILLVDDAHARTHIYIKMGMGLVHLLLVHDIISGPLQGRLSGQVFLHSWRMDSESLTLMDKVIGGADYYFLLLYNHINCSTSTIQIFFSFLLTY